MLTLFENNSKFVIIFSETMASLQTSVVALVVLIAIPPLSLVNAIGLKVDVLQRPPQCPSSSSSGDTMSVHYTGSLTNGTIFDSRFVKN